MEARRRGVCQWLAMSQILRPWLSLWWAKRLLTNNATRLFYPLIGVNIIIIPAIVLMEVLYLFEKARIKIDLIQTETLLKSRNYKFEPLSFEILKTASDINDIPELHDRLIAATARYLNIPLITNDPVIIGSRFVKVLAGTWYICVYQNPIGHSVRVFLQMTILPRKGPFEVVL